MSFFINKKFYPGLSLDTSDLATNWKAHNLAKHMNDIWEQLHAIQLISWNGKQNAANFYSTLRLVYQVGDQV